MMEDLLELYGRIFEEYPPSLFIGTAVWLVTMIGQFKLMADKKIYTRGWKRLVAAEKAGRVVYATRVRVRRDIREQAGTDSVDHLGTYIYEVNGKTYKKVFRKNRRGFPETVKLYYMHSPAKVKTKEELLFWDQRIKPMIVPMILAMLTLLLLGYPEH